MRRLATTSLVLFLGCGSPEARVAAPPPAPPAAALKDAAVFDADGQKRACTAPRADCTGATADRDFLDKCALRGYQARRCGCDTFCSGDVSSAWKFYDAAGHSKRCAPADAGCAPTAASAAFQDACSERGFKLAQCGCEWLCSGKAAP